MLPAGAKAKTDYINRFDVMAAGTVADYDAAKILQLETVVAAAAGVPVASVRVSINNGTTSSNVVIASLIATGTDNATSVSVGQSLATKTATVEKATAMFNGLVTPTSTPSIVVEPGDTLITPGSPDPSGLAVLPGTNRLVPRAKVGEWYAIKTMWKGTVHENKTVPVHDVDPATLPCLLASETAEAGKEDTVPLQRDAPLNCDGTIHQRNDGKPMRRHAKAHISITPNLNGDAAKHAKPPSN